MDEYIDELCDELSSFATDKSHEIKTFKDLYIHLQSHGDEHIYEWLETSWEGKDKQESLLRLFASLNLIDKLSEYEICKGNFNLKTIQPLSSMKEIFYNNKNGLINLKDKGDSSDLTGIHKNNKNNILVTTSKNNSSRTRSHVGKLDIDKIITNFQKYNNYTMTLCICIRNKDDFEYMKNNIEETNKDLRLLVEDNSTICIDWNDLNEAYHKFKYAFNSISISNLLKINKTPLCLKMHQKLGVEKTLKLKNTISNNSTILWGHIQRSGKSYIIGGCIIKDSETKTKCNYLILTTAPKETIEQQLNVFDCIQLQEFNIIFLNGKNKKPKLYDKNIIICSKQFLQTKIGNAKSITWLKELSFDMRFLDESHNGGTTELASKTLKYYGNDSFTIQITATYSKPINDYNIPKEKWILWDLEDIKLCKNITSNNSIKRLVEKHGDIIQDIINEYSYENIINEYSKFPELWLLTDEINPELVSKIIDSTKENNYGWSTESCFLLKQGINPEDNKKIIKSEFQNEEENLKLWNRIFGKRDEFGIPHKDFPDKNVFIKRIEKICKNSLINSRFLNDNFNDDDNPSIIMAFLPQNNINEISIATTNLLIKHNIIPEYEIVSINSKVTNDPKQAIENARIKAKNSQKKAVLVLSGKQCSLGVTIHNCDIVILLNNNMSFDMIYQMMFRCMSEEKGKKCGFVIDLNIHRVINTSITEYATTIKSESHPRDAIKYLLEEKLINLNGDNWMTIFGNGNDQLSKISEMSKNIYECYSSNTERALKHFIDRLKFKEILLSKEERLVFNTMFNNNSNPTEKQKKIIDEFLSDQSKELKKGIEKTITSNEDEKEKEEKEEKNNYMDILKHIIPLICLLTIHNEKTSFIEMFNSIEDDEYIYNILLDQTKNWWGKNINSNVIEKFIQVYIKYMKDDKETNQLIRTIKELFMKNVNNNRQLSILIDKYLIPQELEKKSNAEVSTPYKLRNEMLDKIPDEFWGSIHKVFEPCSGKGGFLIDIIDRFMNGLTAEIPDEKERYRTIVEECLYFSDINPTNIFVNKLLIDPYDEYKLNYNEGNTLELDIQEKWDLDGFDAVIGNPPYNSSGNTGTGNTIWQNFTKKALNLWLIKDGYLLFVHPPGWRKPCYKKSQLKDIFKLLCHNNQMKYLSIHGIKDGLVNFNCGTRYDWYLVKKNTNNIISEINDEECIIQNINLNYLDWLPNYNINKILSILSYNHDNLQVIMNSSYHATRNYVSDKKSDEYKYPLIHSTPKNGIRYKYTNINNKGHFNIPKVIFGEAGINYVILDIDGNYGMTQGSMGIIIKDKDEGEKIKKALLSEKFNNIIKACIWGNYRIDWRLFTYFKKDFWVEFIH